MKTAKTTTKTTTKASQGQKVKDVLKQARSQPAGVQEKLMAKLREEEDQKMVDELYERAQENPAIKKALLEDLEKRSAVHPDAPKGPKRNTSSYMKFLNSNNNRDAMVQEMVASGMTIEEAKKEVTKFAGRRWNSMTPEEKQPYIDAANADKQRYAAELEEFQTTNGIKKGRKKAPGAPKGVRSGYLRFVTERRAEISNELIGEGVEKKDANKQAFAKATEEWQQLTDDQKAPYLELQAQDQLRYKNENAAFKAKVAGDDGENSKAKGQKREREPASSEVPETPASVSAGPPKIQVSKKSAPASAPKSAPTSAAKPTSSSKPATTTPATSTPAKSAKAPAKKAKVDESE